MRDVAVALEAVLVLDYRLEEVGLLNDHQRPEYAMGLDEKRMVLSQTARVATWHATSASPEEATPRLQPASPVDGGGAGVAGLDARRTWRPRSSGWPGSCAQ